MRNALLRPIIITAVMAMAVTTVLFFAGAMHADAIDTSGSVSVRVGPLVFLHLAKQHNSTGSTVSVGPAPGLALIWGLLVTYGLTVSLLRGRSLRRKDHP
jgi:hypothetical protein